ncbi:sulfatase [Candidatus Sumerlaeota bacterium]|nr:sulfatase [Candidatus Sumerlaeota bacterium]
MHISNNKKPNLIFVWADQLRYQSCGFAGDLKAITPNLDYFANEGAVFTNAISGHPVCSAYRASLLTGKYTTSTGMVINELRMNPNHECFAHVLNKNNYQTGYIGKWHLWANELGNHNDPKNSFVPPGPYRLGFDDFWAAYNFNHNYYKGFYHTDSPERIAVEGYEPDAQTNMAIDFINRHANSDHPFALFLSYGAPHDPWSRNNVPPEFLGLFADEGDTPRFSLPPNYKDQNDPYSDSWGIFKDPRQRKNIPEMLRAYYAMTTNLDWNFGRLTRALDKAGIRENTIVVFTSDHGEMLGSQGRRAKNIFYEEAVRIPFLIRFPEKIPAETKSDACLNAPDIMPTILSMMGLDIPEKVEGMDLSGCAYGIPCEEPKAAFMQNTGACAIWEDGYEWRALRDKRYTYAIYKKDGKELLFDNQNDPYQIQNLGGLPEYAETMHSFRALLKQCREEIDDNFELSSWYCDHWTQDRIITWSGRGSNK